MKKHHIHKTVLGRYLLIVFTILVADFLVILGGSAIASGVLTSEYLNTDIYVQQEQVGDSLDQIVYETLSTYARIFTSDNLEELTESTDKSTVYATQVADSHLNSMIFGGVTTYIDGEELDSDNSLPQVLAADVDLINASDNWIDFVRTLPGDSEQYVVLGKKIVNPILPSETIGASFFYIHHDLIQNIIAKITENNGTSFLMNDNHYVIAAQDEADAGNYLSHPGDYPIKTKPHYEIIRLNGVRNVVAITPLTEIASSYGFAWNLVSIQPYNVLLSQLQSMQMLVVITTLVALLVSLTLSYALTRKLIRPIKKLSAKISSFDPSIPPATLSSIHVDDDEIAQLERSYEEMTERIYMLMDKNREDAEYQRKLELDSLQEQINPHFLYNTLDTIAWMAKIKKEPDIEKLVLALAKFFRISLHRGDKFITVEEEVELIQHFLAIELIRFPDKFTVSYNLSEEVRPYKTLKILLQPLVENSIKHGVSSLERMGHITINAYLDQQDVVYEIIDDGIGFVPGDDILKRKKKDNNTHGGFGLFNVNERIKLEY